MRRVGEAVAVRTAQDAPEAFVWRGRIYVVREVLGHWRERRAWWTAAAARAVHGESDRGEVGRGEVDRGEAVDGAQGRAVHGGAEGAVRAMGPGARVVLDDEQEIWRVEASAGRTFGTGVYDLSREPSAWQLLRVTD